MNRHATALVLSLAIVALLTATVAAQGILVDVRSDVQVRLPRPIPMPQPAAVELQDRRARGERQAHRPGRPGAGRRRRS